MTKSFTTTQLVDIYMLSKEQAISTIAKKYGKAYWSIQLVVNKLDEYLSGKRQLAQNTHKQYKQAVKILKQKLGENTQTNGITAKPLQIINDRENDLQALDQAFDHLRETIVSVIENETHRRSQKEVEKYKALYENESKKIEELLAQMKESNLAAQLRKRFLPFA